MALQNVTIVSNPTPGGGHGNYFANFSVAGGGQMLISQNVILTGTQYQISVDMQCVSPLAQAAGLDNSVVYVSVRGPPGTYDPLYSYQTHFNGGVGYNNWYTASYTVNLRAPEPYFSVQVRDLSNKVQANFYIDNIILVKLQ